MKKVFLFTTAVLLLSVFFVSCKKDKLETVTQELQHNWSIESTIDNSHDSKGDHTVNTPGTSEDFLKFNSDFTAAWHIEKSGDAGTYSIINDHEVSINGRVFTIKTLNDKTLVLYINESYSSTDYTELTINATR